MFSDIKKINCANIITDQDIIESDDFFLNAPNIQLINKIYDMSLDKLLTVIISNSYGAATAQGAFNTLIAEPFREERNTVKKDVFLYLIEEIHKINDKLDYRKWHSLICDELVTKFKSIKDKNNNSIWTYGNSQKIINLIVKYIVVITRAYQRHNVDNEFVKIGKMFLGIINQLDIPVDSFIIEAAWEYNLRAEIKGEEKIVLPLKNDKKGYRGKYTNYKVISWSKWGKEDYEAFMNSLHKIFIAPFNWEGYAWIFIKNRRK